MPSVILDTQQMEWRNFADTPGVHYKVLHHHEGRKGITLLLKFAPGTDYPAHRHPLGEEYYVLEGSLEESGVTYGAGTFVHHPPGSVHRPSSKHGCVLLITLPAHIESVGGS